MFTIKTRKKLVSQLQHPLRMKELRDSSGDLMKGTRYQSTESFIVALEEEDVIQIHHITAKNGKTIPIYCSVPLTDVNAYELATSVRPGGYFCNLTAIYHHSLTDQIPNTLYWCHETIVPRKRKRTEKLSDSRIRSAFVKPNRHTSFVIEHNGHDITIIDRERDSDYGVEKVQRRRSPCPIGSRVTTLERTLIDAVVSPQYNGGITSLCDYFRAAGNKLNVARLLEVYRKLNFVYPYAQSLGFLMERTGFRDHAKEIRSAYPPRQRFYVDHSAKTSWFYDERWMIYYPKGLANED